jgi:hypothetical protein
VIFGMDHHQSAVVARRREHIEQLLIIDSQPIIRHKDLDRGMAFAHERRQLPVQHLFGRVGEDHVEGVVNHCPFVGKPVIVLDDLGEIHTDVLGRE